MIKESIIALPISAEQLENLAACAHRMLNYADAEGSLLISVLHSENGTPIRLILDKQCLIRPPP